jgi:hypothetical protein
MANLEEFVRLYNLRAFRDAQPAQGNAQAIAGDSILALREAHQAEAVAVNQEANRANYGPASNMQFLQVFLAQDILLRQFCVYNCNAGLFAGNLAHPNIPKMVQLLSYARFHQRALLPDNQAEQYATYQSYAMAELFGPHIGDDRRLNEADSRAAIIAAVHYLLNNNNIDRPEDAEWFTPRLGLGAAVADVRDIAANAMTIHQALVILEAMAISLLTGNQWLNGISIITTVFASLAKRGTISARGITKIINGVRQDFPGNTVILSGRTAGRFYQQFANLVTAENAQALFAHYTAITPAAAIRLAAVITQASGSGLTTYYTIRRAFSLFPDFPWEQAVARFAADFTAYTAAANLIGANMYYGFNRNIAGAAAANFKSLAYLSFQLCIQAGHDEALANYRGMPTVVPMRAWIDFAIDRYINQAENVQVDIPIEDAQRNVIVALRALLFPA